MSEELKQADQFGRTHLWIMSGDPDELTERGFPPAWPRGSGRLVEFQGRVLIPDGVDPKTAVETIGALLDGFAAESKARGLIDYQLIASGIPTPQKGQK